MESPLQAAADAAQPPPSSQPGYCPFDFSDALEFDPAMRELLAPDQVPRVRMRYGTGEAWIVTRYDQVRAAAADPRLSRAAAVGLDYPRMTPIPIAPPGALMMLDQPDSGRVRAALARAFAAYGTRRLRAHAHREVSSLIERILDRGAPADLRRDLAAPLPLRTIWDVLGIPVEDHAWLREQIDPLKDVAPRQDQPTHHRTVHAYLADLTAERRARPRPDMLSALAAPGHATLTDHEVAALAVSLILGGHDNMTNQVSNIAYTLLARPHLYRLLVESPERTDAVLDELLRHIPYHRGVGTPRVATEDLDLDGTKISAGDVVYVSYVAASRDPRRYRDPDRVDVERAPTGHLAFGWGPHRCPATTLVMTVLETVFTLLPRRLPTLALAVPASEIRWNDTSVLRSPLALPVTW